MKTQMKNFITNDAKTRGWTDEEIAAEHAGERGGGVLCRQRAVSGGGSAIGGYFGAKNYALWGSGGYAGNVAGNAAAYPFRVLANQVAKQRIQNALVYLPERSASLRPRTRFGATTAPQAAAWGRLGRLG
jgi:hypothetical protein